MRKNRTTIIVSVALCIAGVSLQITSSLKSFGQISGGVMIFIGMILFSLCLHDILKDKPEKNGGS